MTPHEILTGMAEITDRYGSWVAHNIHLGHDIYTMGKDGPFDRTDQRRMLQVVADVADKPVNELRVLDLACLEGIYAIEFALHGAQAVGIEGREMNIEKARFAAQVLGLDKIEFYQDDVRNLSAEKYGHFDAVLCCGLLYHLDEPDVFRFVEQIAEVCRRVAVIDTHVSLTDEVMSTEYRGKTYAGKFYQEYPEDMTEEEIAVASQASLHNPRSFWLTRPSLHNLLVSAGFTSTHECQNPVYFKAPPGWRDRPTVLAIRGRAESVLTAPPVAEWSIPDWPEKDERQVHPINMPTPAPIREPPTNLRPFRRIKNSLHYRLGKLIGKR